MYHIYSSNKAVRLNETSCNAYIKWVISHDAAVLTMHARSNKHFLSQPILFIKSPCLFYASVTLSMRIGLLQLAITWYKIGHVGGQAHYYSRTGTLKQRDLNQ